MKALRLLALLPAFVGCAPVADIPPPRPPLVVPGGACESAERQLRVLECTGELRAEGFAAFCHERAAAGDDIRPACIAIAVSCEEADQCPNAE